MLVTAPALVSPSGSESVNVVAKIFGVFSSSYVRIVIVVVIKFKCGKFVPAFPLVL